MNPRQVSVISFLVLLVLITLQLLGIFKLFMTPILWAVILAIVFAPLYRWSLRKLRGHRNIAAFLVTLLVTLLTVGPMVFFSGRLVKEVLEFYGQFAGWIQAKGQKDLWEWLVSTPLGGFLQQVQEKVAVFNIEIVPLAVRFLQRITNGIVSYLQTGAKNFLIFVFNYFVVIFALFFFLRDGEAMANGVKDLVPLSQENKETVFGRVEETVSAVVRGVLVTGLTQGVLAGLAFAVLGVPYPIFLSLLVAFLAFLPLGGAAMVWLPSAAYLYFGGQWGRALILFLFGTLVISMVDNFVKPLVVGGKMRLPMLFLFFSILGGLKFYGFIGVFLGPVMLTLFLTLIQIFRKEYSEG